MAPNNTTKLINQLHWLPLTAQVQFKVLVLVLKSKLGIAPKYLRDHIRSPLSSVSHRPLRSLVRNTLFVPQVRTTMAQTRSFTTIGPSLWNALPSSLRVAILSRSFPTAFSLHKASSWGSRTGSATEWPLLRAAL